MNKALKYWFFAALLILPVVMYNNCSQIKFVGSIRDTSVGNPMTAVSNELLFGLCGVINRCNPQVTLDQCQTGILQTTGFATPLGLPANYSTFSSIEQGEQGGAITGNSSAGVSCYDSINALSCSDPTVVAAYNTASANPFFQSPGMIPVASSCNMSFSSSGPAFVQLQDASVTNTSASVSTPNFLQPVSNGNLMVCTIYYNSAVQSVSGLTDSSGNGYHRSSSTTGGGGQVLNWTVETWSVWNIVGGVNFNVTANFTSALSGEKDIICHEYSGIAAVNAGVNTNGSTGFGPNASSPPISGTQTSLLIFGVATFDSAGANSGAGFTQRGSLKNIVTEDMIVNSMAPYNVTFLNTPENWIVQIMMFKGQ